MIWGIILLDALAILLNIKELKVNIENTRVMMYVILSSTSVITILTFVRKSSEIRQLISDHREVDLKLNQLGLSMEYHIVVYLIIVTFVIHLSYLAFVILNINNMVKTRNTEIMHELIMLAITFPVYCQNYLLQCLYHSNSVLVIVKFDKITNYLKRSIKLQDNYIESDDYFAEYNCAYTIQTSKFIFPLIIDVHFRLCQIYNSMSYNIAIPFIYNTHIFILHATFITYAYIHGHTFTAEYIMSGIYGLSVFFITMNSTFSKKIVSA